MGDCDVSNRHAACDRDSVVNAGIERALPYVRNDHNYRKSRNDLKYGANKLRFVYAGVVSTGLLSMVIRSYALWG